MGADDLDDDFDLQPITDGPVDLEAELGSGDEESEILPRKKQRRVDDDGNSKEEHTGMIFDGASAQWIPAPKKGVSSKTAAELLEAKRFRRKQERKKRNAFLKKKAMPQVSENDTGPSMCATILNNFIKMALKSDLTSVEMERLNVSEDYIVSSQSKLTPAHDTEAASGTTKHDIDAGLNNFAEFVTSVAQEKSLLTKLPEDHGAPSILIIAQSALRAVAIIKNIASLKFGKVAKLFGKHKKPQQQEYFLENTSIICSIGTPARIQKLVDSGHLKLERCKLCILDTSYKDAKGRTIVEQPDVRASLLALFQNKLLDNCRNNNLKLACF